MPSLLTDTDRAYARLCWTVWLYGFCLACERMMPKPASDRVGIPDDD